MLIDKIIIAKTEYSPNQFTGGSIQFSVSKYTRVMDIKLVLYFGFNATRNSISRQIKIKEKDVEILNKELLIKTKSYKDSLYLHDDILSIDEFKKDSYECNTNIVRNYSSDIDNVDKVDIDKVDSDNNAPSNDGTNECDNLFKVIWDNHSQCLKTKKTKDGNPRKNSNKTKTKEKFVSLINKYKPETILCYVRNETLKQSPKELLNLFGKDLDVGMLKVLNIQDDELLNEALDSNDLNFLEFIEAIEDQI